MLIGAVLFAGPAGIARAADLAAMQPPEVEALQKRLVDAGCYKGAIDGQASAATSAAVKACPDQNPVLRIETGRHLADVTAMDADSGCRVLVTTSNDRTIRLWSMNGEATDRIVRLPLNAKGYDGFWALAMSPDRRTIATGGASPTPNGNPGRLILIDASTAQISRTIDIDDDDLIQQIMFSPDEKTVAVATAKGNVLVFALADGKLLNTIKSRDEISMIAFGRDGVLYVAWRKGLLRSYGPGGTVIHDVGVRKGLEPAGLTIDATGRVLAMSFMNSTAVDLLDPNSLRLVKSVPNDDLDGNLRIIEWSASGDTLAMTGLAAGRSIASTSHVIRRIDGDGRTVGLDINSEPHEISYLQKCGRNFIAGTKAGELLKIDDAGRIVTLGQRQGLDLTAAPVDVVRASPDAGQILLQAGKAGPPQRLLFDLKLGLLTTVSEPPEGFGPAKTGGIDLFPGTSDKSPTLDGQRIQLMEGDIVEAYAVRTDHAGLSLTTQVTVGAYDMQGRRKWSNILYGEPSGLTFARQDTLIVMTEANGFVHWIRWSDGQELLTLFVHAPTKRWVAWTPTGYYMASPDGGEDLIGWHLNRGWEQQADFFAASRFRDRFDRPDIVRLVLTTLDEGEAVRRADADAKRRPDTKPLIERLPPVVTILSPTDGASVAEGTVEIRYSVRLPSGGTVDHVEAFVDGAKIGARGANRMGAGTPPPADGTAGSVSLPMPDHDVAISLVAYGSDGRAGDAARLTLKGSAPARDRAAEDVLKPNLYALLVGVTHYDSKGYDLAYPAADAAGLAAALKSQEGRLYGRVEVKVLTDKDATATGIKRGLNWLGKQITAHDIGVVFAAGHGTTDAKGKFWFLSSDMDPDDIAATAVSQGDIENVLFDLPGKKLLFLDACHSGAAFNAGARGGTDIGAAVSDFAQAEGGVVAYAASTGREFSFERSDWGHGAFTKALIEGLGGGADLLHKGTVLGRVMTGCC